MNGLISKTSRQLHTSVAATFDLFGLHCCCYLVSDRKCRGLILTCFLQSRWAECGHAAMRGVSDFDFQCMHVLQKWSCLCSCEHFHRLHLPYLWTGFCWADLNWIHFSSADFGCFQQLLSTFTFIVDSLFVHTAIELPKIQGQDLQFHLHMLWILTSDQLLGSCSILSWKNQYRSFHWTSTYWLCCFSRSFACCCCRWCCWSYWSCPRHYWYDTSSVDRLNLSIHLWEFEGLSLFQCPRHLRPCQLRIESWYFGSHQDLLGRSGCWFQPIPGWFPLIKACLADLGSAAAEANFDRGYCQFGCWSFCWISQWFWWNSSDHACSLLSFCCCFAG